MLTQESILTWMRQLRRRGVQSELRAASVDVAVPADVIPSLVNIGGAAEQGAIVCSLIGFGLGPRRILIVGTHGGRDFWALRLQGHDVVGFNLTDDPVCPGTVVGDAEEPWPFERGAFDAVVMGEILEHLISDGFALSEARRVLGPEGKLVVTVPFLDDEPSFHVRVHTPKSVKRLLENCGFRVERYIERPGLPFKRLLNTAATLAMVFLASAGRPTHFRELARIVGAVEVRLGARPSRLRRIAGTAGWAAWGCTICAAVSPDRPSYKDANIREFGGRG